MKLDFRYTLETEDLIRYRILTVEERLRWLEEQLLFTREFLTPRARRIHDSFRTGANFISLDPQILISPSGCGDNMP